MPNVDGFTKLSVTSPIQVGDRITYYRNINDVYAVTHSGIVTEIDAQGYATKISSKMGSYQIIEHHPRDVPSNYGPESPSITTPNTVKPSREYWRKNTN